MQYSQQRIDEHLAKRDAASTSRQHNVRQSMRRTCLRTVQQYQESTDQRVETGDVSMAREVTSVKHLHTDMNSSDSDQAHGDSDGARSAKREKRIEGELRESTFGPS